MLKTHKARIVRMYGEDRARSLCGRSSSQVWNFEALDNHQNLTTDDDKVTCSYCRRLITAQRRLANATIRS